MEARESFEDRYLKIPLFEDRLRDHVKTLWLRIVTKVVVMAVLGTAIGVSFGLVAAKADAAMPDPVAYAQSVEQEKKMPLPPDDWAAQKFRQGQMGRGHINVNRVWSNPAMGRQILINKIAIKLDQRAKSHGKALAKSPSDYVQQASAMYIRWKDDSDCVGDHRYNPYTSGFDVCNASGPNNTLTPEETRDLVTVTLCGTGVAVGAITGGASVVLMTILGATSCGWGAYLAGSGGGSWRT